jgi:uncharacterized damage-inducible protein DinB
MTLGVTAMLVGVFGIPMALLWLGHRLRRRTSRQRAVFWGALIGYGIGACTSIVASMKPAAMWSDDDILRGVLGFGSLLILPAIGAILGVVLSRHRASDEGTRKLETHMQSTRRLSILTILALALPTPGLAQNTAPAVRAELLRHFNASIGKVIGLAEAMPSERYDWRPEKDAMPVGQVYAHIARYNYYYPATSLSVATPTAIGLDTLEAMRDKAQIVQLLRRSAEHVRRAVTDMPVTQLEKSTRLYGRDVPQWAVLLQLVAHMNEHLGQSIAYARANNVIPPWSR